MSNIVEKEFLSGIKKGYPNAISEEKKMNFVPIVPNTAISAWETRFLKVHAKRMSVIVFLMC